ncbi:DoxX family protein [Flavivirga sp. 57AJ16]|uniref:DoxX family protein n=1 Tax=Flavivirga sp. 57AJ16 TaxID=3025307 RepID=UPI0023670A1A|nr:DoxX family protein [Flavivirga sp. 57AJ16]MDD7885319.1 DoxX family protein [Flavivirga sp. 57AJ16]
MKPLIILIIASAISLFTIKIISEKYDFALSARIGMSVMLLFTALGHFLFTEGMTLMVPELIPFKKETVYFTAIVEILGAIGLHAPLLRPLTSWLLILFFILILPVNIKAAIDHLDYQKATYSGSGLRYLWFRVPLQVLFIVWVYISSIKYQ